MSAVDIISLNMIAASVGTIVGVAGCVLYDWWRGEL